MLEKRVWSRPAAMNTVYQCHLSTYLCTYVYKVPTITYKFGLNIPHSQITLDDNKIICIYKQNKTKQNTVKDGRKEERKKERKKD